MDDSAEHGLVLVSADGAGSPAMTEVDFEQEISALLSQDVEVIGKTLVGLAGGDAKKSRRRLPRTDERLIQECIRAGRGAPAFEAYRILALRTALKSDYQDFIRMILEGENANRLLEDETDIIHAAIDAACSRPPWSHGSLHDTVQLLIDNGASIHSLDSDGNTPLFYACRGGFWTVFKTFIDSGADFSTLHHPVEFFDEDNTTFRDHPSDASKVVSLLEITLNSRLASEKTWPDIWTADLEERWGPMIIFLLDAGQIVYRDDPAIVKFLHIACYQGKIKYVEKFLQLDVDINARAGTCYEQDHIYPTALHAAVRGGQQDIVRALLKHGADVMAEGECMRLGPGCEPKIATPVANALSWTRYREDMIRIIDCCKLLIDAGAGDEDGVKLLDRCIEYGSAAVAHWLLERGIRPSSEPIGKAQNAAVVGVLCEHDVRLNARYLQRHAVERGDLELLRYLVQQLGQQLSEDDMSFAIWFMMKDVEMLRYFITDYGLDVNAPLRLHSCSPAKSSFLLHACENRRFKAVKLLLERGADQDFHILETTALSALQKNSKSKSWNLHGFANNIMPFIKLLLQHGNADSSIRKVAARIPKTRLPQSQSNSMLANTQTGNPEDTKSPATVNGQVGVEMDTRLAGSALEPVPSRHPATSDEGSHRNLSLIFEHDSRVCREPLDGRIAMRMIELEPSKSLDSPIVCRLSSRLHAASSPDYDVLSFDWGKKPYTRTIIVNEEAIEVPNDLVSGLQRLRLAQKPRYLWIDFLCIDWSSVIDKTTHIGNLHSTHRNASRLLVWLGEEGENSALPFQRIRKWHQWRDDVHAGVKAGRIDVDDPGLDNGMSLISRPDFQGATKEAYLKLCLRPWFFRSWSLLELAMNHGEKKVFLLCGQHIEEMGRISPCSSYGFHYHPFEKMDGQTRLYNLLDCGGRPFYGKVMRYLSLCQTEDPRERVFSFLGIFRGNMPEVDYQVDPIVLFTEFTKAVILASNNLEALQWMGTEPKMTGLPSWVPDFSLRRPTGVLPRVFGGGASYAQKYPDKLLPGLKFEGTNMFIRGRFVETIDAVGDELIADKSCTRGSPGFTRVIRNWEELVAQLRDRKRFSQGITDAFMDTISASDDSATQRAKRPFVSPKLDSFIPWYARFGQGVLADADRAYFNEVEEIRDWITVFNNKPYVPYRDNMTESTGFAFFMEKSCYGRRLFVTDKGSMGLAPPDAKAGDSIVYLAGALYPFVLRDNKVGAFTFLGDCFLYDFDAFGLFGDTKKDTIEYVIR